MANGCPRRRSSSCRPGKTSRNPYINFLRDYRKKHCGLHPVEVIRQGACAWNRLSDQQRLPYIRTAFYRPIRREPCSSTRGRRSRSRGRSVSRSRSRSRSRRR